MNYSMDIVPILVAMNDAKATSKAFALTVDQILDVVIGNGVTISRYTVQKCVEQLLKGGVLENGFYKGRSFTYYIGEKGKEFYEKEIGV